MDIGKDKPPSTYFLIERFIGGKSVEIGEDQFKTLSAALTTVISALNIEEIFQIFAKSYVRFEKDLLDIALEYTFANEQDQNLESLFRSARHRLNISIITILTAFQSYDDQCRGTLKGAINSNAKLDFYDRTRSKIFDAHLSYRICANLRNYAQHRALPMGGFSIGNKSNLDRDSSGTKRKLDSGFNVSPWLNVPKFTTSSQCKAKLREELENIGLEKIDMKWLIRSFAGAMYERHSALRGFLQAEIETAGGEISKAYDKVSAVKKSEAKFLELHGNDEERPMRNDLASKVLTSFGTFSSLKRAEFSYVTSRITPEATTYSGQVDD